ncbi:50S ribosomal protein L10 [Botrimarina hoheduenensis]|uniref:Large ribosomal subunit protein uL10 n=1 Tax=Botrimarina hoheduenensis TaxID=2528000 RepID=A0A5C5W8M9_9BACT|nr:50S ribosomal protein L10 [Botrimarina hoheduenensis]TWT46613.1 50S ribosomal protein L10 [Botrimarina hoheduenensis]
MSKFVKNLMIQELVDRWDGVEQLMTVDTTGLTAEENVALRRRFRGKGVSMMVIRNSLARRAAEGTSLAPAFEGASGMMAAIWGGEDVVALAKEVMSVADGGEFKKFSPIGGVLDGEALSADDVKAVSKWPTRTEMLSTLMGQVMGPAMTLSGQLLGPGKLLASQVKKKSEEEAGEA